VREREKENVAREAVTGKTTTTITTTILTTMINVVISLTKGEKEYTGKSCSQVMTYLRMQTKRLLLHCITRVNILVGEMEIRCGVLLLYKKENNSFSFYYPKSYPLVH
jgi:hypothetical protein